MCSSQFRTPFEILNITAAEGDNMFRTRHWSNVATLWRSVRQEMRLPVVLSRLAAIVVAVGLLFASQTLATPERAAAADPGYLMLHFTNDAQGQKLWLSHST